MRTAEESARILPRHLHEECGVFGIFAPQNEDLAGLVYYGLYALQHRGQESAGIAINDDGVFSVWRDVARGGAEFTKTVMHAVIHHAFLFSL